MDKQRIECKTKIPVSMDPSRLKPSVLTTECTLKSSLVDGLLKKHHDLLNSPIFKSSYFSKTTTSFFLPSKRGGISQRGAPPIKKVKKVENVQTLQHSCKEPRALSSKQKTKGADKVQDVERMLNEGPSETENIFLEVNYDNSFEKMEIEEEWECDFGTVLSDDNTSVCSSHFASKKHLLNLVNVSLVETPNFRRMDCKFRSTLLKLADAVADNDPEFILKVSLYSRKHLNIRTTSNFLVAYAAMHAICKSYLSKYYSSIVVLPSDWIEIAEFALTLCGHGKLVFPSSLRRVMTDKFREFDKYQLGKYNKDKTKNKKRREKRKAKAKAKAESSKSRKSKGFANKQTSKKGHFSTKRNFEKTPAHNEDGKEFNIPHFTIKQLIRKLHISEPVDHVMSLVGKKYPLNLEEFSISRLPGVFDEERAGKRMKLPVPETWETQISLRGNKAKVWEELIDDKKLPFMAMLRNLRNLIKANISGKHHEWVRGRLINENAVINSKQFPFRFFSAYEVLNKIAAEKSPTSKSKVLAKRPNVRKSSKTSRKTIKDLTSIIERYRAALDKAVVIATKYNIPPMPGHSIIFCDLCDSNVNKKTCSSARGLGECKTVGKMAVLLSLMCKHSCEEGHLMICGTNSMEEVGLGMGGTILKNAENVLQLESLLNRGWSDAATICKYISNFIDKIIYNKTKIDRWIIIGGGNDELTSILSSKIEEYRQAVNPHVLGFQVNLAPEPSSSLLNEFDGNEADNNQRKEGFIHLFGFSEQTLRFMVERGDRSQITFVENIDRLHKLEDSKHLKKIKESQPCLPDMVIQETPKMPRWSNCRIFISSTFLDMFSERDLLVKYIFQELKARARSLHVNIFEVDLRWGISEEQSQNNETIHLCLSEVTKCQFFVGILGERYGWCPEDHKGLSSYPGMEWIEKHPKGASLTELEFYQCFRSLDVKTRAFFFFRDPEFLKEVPLKHRHLVVDNNEQRLKNLKRFVINSGAEVYKDYPCYWGGLDEDGKARVTDLEYFGKRVLDMLWNAIKKTYSANEDEAGESCDINDDIERNLHLSYVDFLNSRFAGRQNVVNSILNLINSKKTGLILLTGKPGSGKSAIMASVCKHWMDSSIGKRVLIHCVNASPSSENIVRTLFRLIAEMDVVPMPPAYWETGTFDLACKLFHESLKILSSRNIPVQVFIDGVDYFSNEHNARLMTWLPLNIPQNVLFIVSTNGNSDSHNALKNRPSLVGSLDIGPLSLPEKQAIIRETLKLYSKTLDESAFNNQMRLITAKSESSSPLYLSLICEEMRQFGDFERVNSKLVSLPPTLTMLMQNLIDGLEKSHGDVFVRSALCCLAVSKEGLKEYELQDLLSRALDIQWTEAGNFRDVSACIISPQNLVSPSSVLFFIRSIQHLLRPNTVQESGEVVVSIGYSGVKEVIRQRYMATLEGKKYEKFIHTLLASCFYHYMDPNLDKNFKPVDRRVLSSLTYHLVQCQDYQIIVELLTDLSFIEYEFMLKLSKELLEAYQIPVPTNTILKKAYDLHILSKRYKDYQNFVFKNAHLLSRLPQLTIQQALLEADDSRVLCDCNEMLAVKQTRIPYARWLNKGHHQDLCIQSIAAQGSSCLDLSSDETLLAVGFETAIIKIYKTTDYEAMQTLIGHSGGITSICFVSNNRICSASKDGTLSLWDVMGGYRLAVMEKHNRAVTSCASDQTGRIIVSAGLDATINVWHGITGSFEAALPRDGCPINCLSLHPEGQLVVTGAWDSNLKIWDIVQKDKRATLKGHSGSVQDVKFSLSGQQITSVDILGEVRIWSAQHGCMVGFIKSQAHLTTRVFYSGNELLLSTSNGTVKVLSGTLGRCTNIFGESNHGSATCVAFDQSPETPLPDVVVGYHTGCVRMFSCSSGNQAWERNHHGPPVAISCISFHHDSKRKYIVTGRADGTCQLLAAENSKTLGIMIGHSDPVTSVASSKKYLITAGGYSLNVHKFDELANLSAGSSHKPNFTLEEHRDVVMGISMNSSGDMLASVGRDRMIIIWNMEESFKVLLKFDEAHRDWITCCCWSNSSEFLVTGSNDFTVKIWDINKEVLKHTLVGHDSMVTGVSFKHGCIVSSSSDGCLKVWSHKGIYLSSLLAPHIKCNSCDLFTSIDDSSEENDKAKAAWADMSILEDAKGSLVKQKSTVRAVVVASCYDDGTVRIWSPNEADEKHLLIGHKKEVVAVTSGSHGLIVSSSADGFLKVWKVPRSQKGSVGCTKEQSSAISCLSASPDGRIICASTRGGCVKAWMLSDFNGCADSLCHPQFSVQVGFSQVTCLHFLSNNLLVSTSDDCGLSLWQVQNKNGLSLSRLKTEPCDQPIISMTSLETRQDSFHLATVHFQGSIRLWKISSDKKADILQLCEKQLEGLQFFGAHIFDEVTSFLSYLSNPNEVVIYHVEVVDKSDSASVSQLKLKVHRTEKKISSPIVSSFVHDPFDGYVYHGTLNGCLFVWKGDEHSSPCYDAYKLHRDQITGLVLVDDILFTTSLDGQVKVFDIKNRKVVGELTTPFRITSMIELYDQTGPPHTRGILCGTECGTFLCLQWNVDLSSSRRS